jgi:hypothetical protein
VPRPLAAQNDAAVSPQPEHRTGDLCVEHHEALGRHLANAVHTGTFCSYTPERPTTWEL